MSESVRIPYSELRDPGLVITMPRGTGDLNGLEALAGRLIIANNTVPEIGIEPDIWTPTRTASEIIKPNSFHGRLLGIQAIVMKNPVDLLIEAEQAKREFSDRSGTFNSRSSSSIKDARLGGYGFHVRGVPTSTQRRFHYQPVVADIWYMPSSKTTKSANANRVLRYISSSSWSEEQFVAHCDAPGAYTLTYEEIIRSAAIASMKTLGR